MNVEWLPPLEPGLRDHQYNLSALIGHFGKGQFFYLANFEADDCDVVSIVEQSTGQRIRITFGTTP